MNIFLVRPHPPKAILKKSCPVNEAYKYNWQPMALKLIAYHLKETFKDDIDIKIWHLMNENDDDNFKNALIANKPDIVAFSEIDILIPEVNRLARSVKKILPDSWTIVGGKHTSLLNEGDSSPFENIDFLIRGEGLESILKIIEARMQGRYPKHCAALVNVDSKRKVIGKKTFEKRCNLSDIDGMLIQSIDVENHSNIDYFENQQIHPALINGKIRTASVLAGSGCQFKCIFCQSPVEYGSESKIVKLRDPERLADEIAYLANNHKVNNIFSLEANMSFENWLKTYEYLESYKINNFSISGFVRAADILKAHKKGILIKLRNKGMRVLSVGIDIPCDSESDPYGKSFTKNEMLEAFSVCEELGIIILSTFIGDPNYTLNQMKKQLQFLKEIPVSTVDIRLSIALRNTEYYAQVEPWLIFNPKDNKKYFSRQNYRYQTIKIPGKITPQQTYREVGKFHKEFLISDSHLDYVLRFLKRFPESIGFFKSQYAPFINGMKIKNEKLTELMNLFEAYEVSDD